LDYDPTINGAMTFEAYKNLVMRETGDIFEAALTAAGQSDDADMREVAKSYADPKIEAPEEALDRFKDGLKKSVDNLLAQYSDKFNQRELERLRQECYVYVTL
jgi:uncharacterized iron-regulated protein